jgi:hypothetical protein
MAGVAATGVIVGVYRQANAARMRALVPPGWRAAFWALDAESPDAADVTVGCGAAPKFALCNRLVAAAAPAGDEWVVVVDDDVLVPSGLPAFLDVAAAAAFGLAQPAHSKASKSSHPITVVHPLCRARWTTYVEIGPIFAIAPDWRDRLLPFPEDMGMGWGLDLLWMDQQANGLRLGVVDAVPMEHLVPPGLSYDMSPEGRRVETMLRERDVVSMGDLQRTRGRWWRWERRPRWRR